MYLEQYRKERRIKRHAFIRKTLSSPNPRLTFTNQELKREIADATVKTQKQKELRTQRIKNIEVNRDLRTKDAKSSKPDMVTMNVKPNYYWYNLVQDSLQEKFNMTIDIRRSKDQPVVRLQKKLVDLHYYNHFYSLKDVRTAFDQVNAQQQNAYKVQMYMGIVAQKRRSGEEADRLGEWGEIMIWNNDFNNKTFLFQKEGVDRPLTVSNAKDFDKVLKMITGDLMLTSAQRIIKESQVRILGVYNVMFRIWDTNISMGNVIQLPEYYEKSRYVNCVVKANYNMCFWSCLAIFNGSDRCRYESS